MFTYMPERRMPKVVSKACRLYYLYIQAGTFSDFWFYPQQILCQAPANLRNFDRVSQAIVENIRFACAYYLGNSIESPECCGI